MSKILRTTAVSAVALGLAVAAPLSAQAKTEPALLNGPVSVPSCASATAQAATGTIAGLKFSVTVPVVPAGAAYETRARYFTLGANGQQVFSTRKVRVSNVSDTGTGFVQPGQHVWRLDVVDINAEAAGLPSLAYTSGGFAACD